MAHVLDALGWLIAGLALAPQVYLLLDKAPLGEGTVVGRAVRV